VTKRGRRKKVARYPWVASGDFRLPRHDPAEFAALRVPERIILPMRAHCLLSHCRDFRRFSGARSAKTMR
jgi:hypothetical protein